MIAQSGSSMEPKRHLFPDTIQFLSEHESDQNSKSQQEIRSIHSDESIIERRLSNNGASTTSGRFPDSNRGVSPKARMLDARALLEWVLSRCTGILTKEHCQRKLEHEKRGSSQQQQLESGSLNNSFRAKDDEDEDSPPSSRENGKRLWLNGCLSSLLHSLGKARLFDARLVQCVESCLTEEQLLRCNNRELANISWGFARLSYRPSRAWVRGMCLDSVFHSRLFYSHHQSLSVHHILAMH